MILVVGATGTVGRETVKSLKAKGVSVKAASRDPEKAQAELGVPAVTWDFERPQLFARALDGVRALLLVTPPGTATEREYGLAAIAAAKAAGVQKIVKLSAIGVENQPESTHRQLELAIEKEGFEWTFLRPSFFMQNCSETLLAGIKHERAIFLPAGQGRTGFIDARDIGAVAAEALTGQALVGRSLALTGSEALTYGEVASQLSEVVGASIRYVEISPEQFKQALLGFGVIESYCDLLNMLYGFVKAGYMATVTAEVEELTGRAPIKFSKYARDYAPFLT